MASSIPTRLVVLLTTLVAVISQGITLGLKLLAGDPLTPSFLIFFALSCAILLILHATLIELHHVYFVDSVPVIIFVADYHYDRLLDYCHRRLMDAAEPDHSPYAAFTAQTSRLSRAFQSYLDRSTPYTAGRWVGTGILVVVFLLRVVFAHGWYIVAYTLGIYLLNLFLGFLQPKFDPSMEQDTEMEDGSAGGGLPTKRDEEFRPFIRRLPEFKFWYAATRALVVGFACTWFRVFDIPVFWPVLVVYWVILFTLTMRRQIQHMIKYRYVPFSFGKLKYGGGGGGGGGSHGR
ncbi:MAG: hypothetical protein M1826_006766 [Phylliscum demangeonii]|nr:MAG: hypothetical protein M1826_006766 [Phylliscum demangeonii]